MTGCVIHTLYYIFKKKTGNIITFEHFEEGNLLCKTQNLSSETRDDTESSNEYDDNLTMPTLINEEEMNEISSGNEYDDEPMSTEMLEYICDISQSNPIINRREAR